ncbi:MAG: DUF1622 domain-containing protein [Thermoleophilia bacterium]
MEFSETMNNIAKGVEAVGIAVLVIGILYAFGRGFVELTTKQGGTRSYLSVRKYVGRAILLGLEILIVADLIRTVTVDPTLTNVAVLGVIVIIRTFLSMSLEIEISGVLPWRRGSVDAADGQKEGIV